MGVAVLFGGVIRGGWVSVESLKIGIGIVEFRV